MSRVGTSELESGAVTSDKVSAVDGALKYKSFLHDTLAGTQQAAVGSYTLPRADGAADSLPENAVIMACALDVKTAYTSGGAGTLAIGVTGSTAKIQAAAAVSGAPWSTTGSKAPSVSAPINVGTNSGSALDVLATVATADLTAGKSYVLIAYATGV